MASFKPFVLAKVMPGSLAEAEAWVEEKARAGNLEVVGKASPLEGVTVFAVTNGAQMEFAAKSKCGGFGACLRVACSLRGDSVEIAYTHPGYMACVYRMEGNNEEMTTLMADTFGCEQEFGTSKPLTEKKLRKYHYKLGMPYFNEPVTLGSHGSFAAAVEAVEQGLEKKLGGCSKVFRVDVPGKDEAVFGVTLGEGYSDSKIMNSIDVGTPKHSPHMFYEILVTGKYCITLNAKFRIAISWPDLDMVGSHSFGSIMTCPQDIEKMLKKVAANK